MKKKLSVLLAMSVICVAVLAGCGKSEGPKTINDTKKEETKGSGKLAEKQEMTFILNNEPDTIDPNVTSNSFAVPFLVNCFEGLVTYNEEERLSQEMRKNGNRMMTLRFGLSN